MWSNSMLIGSILVKYLLGCIFKFSSSIEYRDAHIYHLFVLTVGPSVLLFFLHLGLPIISL